MADALARQIEQIVDAIASATLACALFVALRKFGIEAAFAGAGTVAAAGLSWCVLRAIPPEALQFALPDFAPSNLTDEDLVLTDADRIGRPAELMLDEIAAHVGSGSRVVRLFDASAMPTAGELGARIDRHLQQQGTAGVVDASQDLFDALAQLRRSLR